MVPTIIAAGDGRRRRQLLKEKEIRRELLRFPSYASGAADDGQQPDADGMVDPISKAPLRFLVAMDRENHTLSLLREHREAVLNFLPWTERERVVWAGDLTGRRGRKVERLGLQFMPAQQLKHTGVVDGVYGAFGLMVVSELEEPRPTMCPSYATLCMYTDGEASP